MVQADDRAIAFKNQVAVVGIGTTNHYGTYANMGAYGMAQEAFKNALDDCGLTQDDIDGLIVGSGTGEPTAYDDMARYLGVHPRVAYPYSNGGRLFGPSVMLMASLVASGQCDNVAFVYTNNARTARVKFGGQDEGASAIHPAYGFTSPGANAAIEFRRYLHEFNQDREKLAAVAIGQRKSAALNPMAIFKDRPLTFDDYVEARYIAEPLRLNDYCIINDGAIVFILSRSDRAKDLKKPPVYIRAASQQGGWSIYHWQDGFEYEPYSRVASRVYGAAGITPKDVDALFWYDAFAPFLLYYLEGFGFCGKGEALDFIQGGRIELGGELPVNTSGGHLSETYLQGRAIMVEAVRQIRGECGPRQVPNAEIVQFIGTAPNASSFILSKE
ncbi:MAG: thiolase family protein [Chloroflexota bacterium]